MIDYREIPGWFPLENETELERLIADHNVRSVIEIGSFLGKSAVWFAQHKQIERVFCVDRWFEFGEAPSNNNLVSTMARWALPRDFFPMFRDHIWRAGCFDKVVPIRGASRDVHDLVEPCDLVYIDGDHTYAGVCEDIRLYGPKAMEIICGDDYAPEFEGVIRGVRDMLYPTVPCHSGRFWWGSEPCRS